jgi:malonate decarboxylase gamma subunit
MAYDIRNYATLGLLWKLLRPANPDQPGPDDVALVRATLEAALADIVDDEGRDLAGRLNGVHRQASRTVRQKLREQWEAAS